VVVFACFLNTSVLPFEKLCLSMFVCLSASYSLCLQLFCSVIVHVFANFCNYLGDQLRWAFATVTGYHRSKICFSGSPSLCFMLFCCYSICVIWHSWLSKLIDTWWHMIIITGTRTAHYTGHEELRSRRSRKWNRIAADLPLHSQSLQTFGQRLKRYLFECHERISGHLIRAMKLSLSSSSSSSL